MAPAAPRSGASLGTFSRHQFWFEWIGAGFGQVFGVKPARFVGLSSCSKPFEVLQFLEEHVIKRCDEQERPHKAAART